MKKILIPITAAAVLAAPVTAQVAPVTAPIEGEALGDDSGSATPIALALVAGVIAIGVLAIADDDDDPVSP